MFSLPFFVDGEDMVVLPKAEDNVFDLDLQVWAGAVGVL